MSMRGANPQRTICEVLREINDYIEPHTDKQLVEQVCPRLREAEKMSKRMARKLLEYNKEWDKNWWEKNADYEEDLKLKTRAE